jgi:hypothetical protein
MNGAVIMLARYHAREAVKREPCMRKASNFRVLKLQRSPSQPINTSWITLRSWRSRLKVIRILLREPSILSPICRGGIRILWTKAKPRAASIAITGYASREAFDCFALSEGPT